MLGCKVWHQGSYAKYGDNVGEVIGGPRRGFEVKLKLATGQVIEEVAPSHPLTTTHLEPATKSEWVAANREVVVYLMF